ncbi:hypothetical protein CXF68_01960 [Tenacibaculum sp. Bg11-29]|uniref:hypothetical protein n=1 Tax=Tenacibaculum sp. Bg11-29 TaxID=2058306 RepID=UPI000C32B900|nr:hypothetical protein [Tenacibaculum sp. Bg11-29]PKH49528.1 hypothetical protein CXF68_01960 [Tenacibaculum sp. Bg11-29]
MKDVKQKTIKVSNDLMNELNQVLKKYDLGNVHIESIRLKKGAFQNCRRVCKLWTNPKTGERKVICKMVCD